MLSIMPFNITEIEPEKPIVVSKFEMSCDQCDKSIPKPLPQILNFFMVIVGRPGSGKTNLLLNLTAKHGRAFNKKFDRVFLWSPSLGTINNDPFETLPDEQKFDDLDEDNLQDVLDEIADSGDRCLFIWDDIISNFKNNGPLEKLCHKVLMNRRHLAGPGGSVSVIMTSQVFNKTPSVLRKVATHLVLFSTKNKKELLTIFDELILIPKAEFYSVMSHCFQRRYDFMYIDLAKHETRMFHRCFNLLNFRSLGSEIERNKRV